MKLRPSTCASVVYFKTLFNREKAIIYLNKNKIVMEDDDMGFSQTSFLLLNDIIKNSVKNHFEKVFALPIAEREGYLKSIKSL